MMWRRLLHHRPNLTCFLKLAFNVVDVLVDVERTLALTSRRRDPLTRTINHVQRGPFQE